MRTILPGTGVGLGTGVSTDTAVGTGADAVRPGGAGLLAVALLALMCAFAAPAQSAPSVPLSVYGQLPSIEDVALSPDGSRVAYVRTQGELRVIFVATVADHKLIRWVKTGEEKLRELEWADNDNLLLTTSLTTSVDGFKAEWRLLRDYKVSQNELVTLPGKALGARNAEVETVVGEVMVRRVGGHTVLFVPGLYDSASDGAMEDALFKCDLTSGLTNLVRVGSSDDTSWLVDDQGKLAAEQDYDERSEHWSINLFRGGSPADAASGHSALDVPTVLGFGPSPGTLLVESTDTGVRLWRQLSTTDGKFSAMPDGTVFDYPIMDPLTGRMIGGENDTDLPQFKLLDPALDTRWKAIVQAFQGDSVSLISSSSDFSKVVVLLQGPKYGFRYILIDLAKNDAVPIGKVYDGIDSLLEVRRINYAAADGFEIPAYLTLPANRAPHDLPLIVLPHGGPVDSDTAEFDWWSQALADQGYAVLRPNYRGSDLSVGFIRAGYGQWGRKMQTDLSDGVRYLVKQGIADPARVCIVGASYGGYAALAGVTLDPGVYRCAVSVAGISDLARFLSWHGRGGLDDTVETRFWDQFWGVSGASDPKLDAISPIKHIDAVKVPVLLIHGRDDTIVPYEQSQIMYDALRKQGKDVELVTLKHEDHWLSRGDTREQMLEATVAFLRAHDPPD